MNLKNEKGMEKKAKTTEKEATSTKYRMVALGKSKAIKKLEQYGMILVPERLEQQFLEHCQRHGKKVANVATSESKDGCCTLYAEEAQKEALKASACAVMLTRYGNVTLSEELCGLMERILDNCGFDVAYKVTDAADTVDGTMLRCEMRREGN